MDAQTAAGIGHNSGDPEPIMVIDGLLDDLTMGWRHKVSRRDDLLAGYARFCIASADGIHDDEAQGKAGDFAKQLKAEVKLCEAIREEVKRPVLDATRIIDGFFKGIADPLRAAATEIERRMTTFAREKADAARRAAEEERRRLAEEAARAAAAAADEAAKAAPAPPAWDEPEAPVIAAPPPIPKPAEASRVHGDLGSVSSLRGKWTYEIEDEAAIPRSMMMPNERMIRAAIASGKREIPGLRIFNEQKVVVR